jgi:hypothetical protein
VLLFIEVVWTEKKCCFFDTFWDVDNILLQFDTGSPVFLVENDKNISSIVKYEYLQNQLYNWNTKNSFGSFQNFEMGMTLTSSIKWIGTKSTSLENRKT